MMAKFAVGAVVMRGAGCTINDMWDRDIDKRVARTRSRPIASGAITREQALVFLAAQLTAGLAVLVSFNFYSIILGAASIGLVVIYPLMKRYTDWPQLVLGLTFNWGALLGASAVHVPPTRFFSRNPLPRIFSRNPIASPSPNQPTFPEACGVYCVPLMQVLGHCPWEVCLPLYAGSVCWTIVYDTIYAHQDKAGPPVPLPPTLQFLQRLTASRSQVDDRQVGVRSTALLFGSNTRPILSGFSAAFVASLWTAGSAAGLGTPYFASLGAASVHLAWQVWSVDLDSPKDCMAKFVSNTQLGGVVAAGVIAGKLMGL